MKNRKSSAKKSECRILENQAEKLKDKLQNLKEQIKLKKQQKKMNETATSLGSYQNDYKYQNKQQRLNTSQNTRREEDQDLLQVLKELKIQNIASKLEQKSVSKIDHLLRVNEEQIDKWKDIPVGYRIKLKKYIQKTKSKPKVSQLNVVQANNEIKKDEPSIKNIEQIIKNRKAEKVYMPIDRKIQEAQQKQFIRQLEESQQQDMMRSILQVLGGKYRKSIIKKQQKSSKQKKRVNWSQSVNQMQEQHKEKRYPKEKISKQIFHQRPNTAQLITKDQEIFQKAKKDNQMRMTSTQNEIPDYKYCWTCLKRINQSNICQNQRYFCCKQCFQTYNQQVNPTQFFVEILQVEEKYNKLKQKSLDAKFQEENEISFDIM